MKYLAMQQLWIHRIRQIKVHIPELSIPEQKVYDQNKRDYVVTENGRQLEMTEAATQSFFQSQSAEKNLKHDDSGKRRELLILEFDYRNSRLSEGG